MSESLLTRNAIERLANGYRTEIARLEQEQGETSDPVRLNQIALMLNAKRWHLDRHLADIEIAPS
jgi:hypothetical protein